MSAVIRTRYRDIPWEEAQRCSLPADVTERARLSWERLRGCEVAFIAPATGHAKVACDGPFFIVHPETRCVDGKSIRVVCPHIAEIGD